MPVQLQKWHQCDLARPGWLFQTSKTTAAWWLPSNLRSMPLAMTCQINDQDPRQGIFHLPQHRARLRWEDWQQLATYNFTASLFCTARPLFRILLDHGSCPRVVILAQPPLLQRAVLRCAEGPAQLGRTFLVPWQYNFKSGTSAIWQEQDGFCRQAKLPLHGGCHRTWEVCHWAWHVKSRIKTQDKASSIFQHLPTQSWIALEHRCLPANLQLHFFALHNFYVWPFYTVVAVPKPWFLGSRLWCWNLGSKGPNNQQGLEELFWNLAIASSRVAPVQDVF